MADSDGDVVTVTTPFTDKNKNIELVELKNALEYVIYRRGKHFDKAATDERGLTLLLDGPLGSGKTFFLNYLQEQLREEDGKFYVKDLQVVKGEQAFSENRHKPTYEVATNKQEVLITYINIFKLDGMVNPLTAFMGSVYEQHESVINKNGRKLVSTLLTLTKNIARVVSPVAGGIVAGAIQTGEQVAQQSQIDELEQFKQFKQKRKEFKTFISNLGKTDSTNPIKLFIIDDLERCHPEFAYELLEAAKHFFETDNVVFLFATDKRLLSGMLKRRYGDDLDTDRFLSRFFDFELEYPGNEIFRDAIVEEKMLQTVMAADNKFFIKDLMKFAEMDIRDIERFFRYAELIAEKNLRRNDMLLLVYLKTLSKQRFKELCDYSPKWPMESSGHTRLTSKDPDFYAICQKAFYEGFLAMLRILFPQKTFNPERLKKISLDYYDLYKSLLHLYIGKLKIVLNQTQEYSLGEYFDQHDKACEEFIARKRLDNRAFFSVEGSEYIYGLLLGFQYDSPLALTQLPFEQFVARIKYLL